MTEALKPVPTCPACRSSATHHEQGDRHQCDRCGWRFVVLADGSTRDFINMAGAGRGNGSRRSTMLTRKRGTR